MTSSRTLAAAGVLMATLAVAGCSFSGDAQSPDGSTSASPESPRASHHPATPAKPATPSTTTSPGAPATPTPTSPGSPTTPGSPPASPPPPKAAAPAPSRAAGTTGSQDSAPDRCTADALNYGVPVPTGGSGGSASATTSVVLTNTTSTPCTLSGYPGVSFVAGGDGHQLGAAADRRQDGTPARVTLAPGGSASAPLTIAADASVGAGCQPGDAVGIKVYPPGSTDSVLVSRSVTVCGAADAHQLAVGPLRAG